MEEKERPKDIILRNPPGNSTVGLNTFIRETTHRQFREKQGMVYTVESFGKIEQSKNSEFSFIHRNACLEKN